jgi:hypothetical protein
MSDTRAFAAALPDVLKTLAPEDLDVLEDAINRERHRREQDGERKLAEAIISIDADLVEIEPGADGARRYKASPRVLNKITENFQ